MKPVFVGENTEKRIFYEKLRCVYASNRWLVGIQALRCGSRGWDKSGEIASFPRNTSIFSAGGVFLR
jgi:hypothetical protein